MTLAVATAVSASGQLNRPTHTAAQVPASACSRLVSSSGAAKRTSVGVIGASMKRAAWARAGALTAGRAPGSGEQAQRAGLALVRLVRGLQRGAVEHHLGHRLLRNTIDHAGA